jgi:uncharacterized protein YjiS (DUF1127 family)
MSVGIQKTRALSCLGIAARSTPTADISLKDIRLKGFSTLIVNAMDTVLDWQDRARQRRHLGEMDDHLLRDIGLSRADLEYESSKPFWRA